MVLATVLTGLFSVTFTITILAVSIPRIAGDLGTTEPALTWIITGPLLALGVLSPAAGKAGDLWGHKRMFIGGNLVAAGFAALTAAAWSAGSIVGFRVLGAAAGSVTAPAASALINRLYPREERVRAMGWFSFVGAGAPVLGVVAGGPVVENIGWRWIFVAQAPMLVLVAILGLLLLPSLSRQEGVTFDIGGAAALGLSITSVLYALNRGPDAGWSSLPVVAGFVAGPALMGLFVAIERRVASPLIPLDFFTRRNFAVPAVGQFCMNFAYMGGFIVTPLLLANVYGFGETKVGLLSIPRPIAFALAGPIAGYVATRVGERSIAVLGAGGVAVSMLLLNALTESSAELVIMASLAVSGVGMGAAGPAFTASVANSVSDADQGIAGATLMATQQIGTVAGIQLLQTVQQARVDVGGLLGSYQDAYLLGFVVSCGALVSAFFIRSTERAGRRHDLGAGVESAATGGEGGRLAPGSVELEPAD